MCVEARSKAENDQREEKEIKMDVIKRRGDGQHVAGGTNNSSGDGHFDICNLIIDSRMDQSIVYITQ